MKHLLSVLLLTFALMTSACAVPLPPIREPAREESAADRFDLWTQIATPTVQIRRVSSPGSGTGVVVHQDAQHALIVTALHVVGETSTLVMLHQHPDLMIPGVMIRSDVAHDLALIETPPVWRSAARVVLPSELGQVAWGCRVVAYGHPMGTEQGVLTDGRVTALDDDGFLRYSAPTFFGNSGGGVFMKIDGRWTLISISQRVMGYGDQIYSPCGLGARPAVLRAFVTGGGIDDVR
jgi:S1-C subfamily serine protease